MIISFLNSCTNRLALYNQVLSSSSSDITLALTLQVVSPMIYVPASGSVTLKSLLGPQFYDVCSDYQTQVEDNPDATLETRLFEEGEEMTSVVFNVSRRLGVPLVLGMIMSIYICCT